MHGRFGNDIGELVDYVLGLSPNVSEVLGLQTHRFITIRVRGLLLTVVHMREQSKLQPGGWVSDRPKHTLSWLGADGAGRNSQFCPNR